MLPTCHEDIVADHLCSWTAWTEYLSVGTGWQSEMSQNVLYTYQKHMDNHQTNDNLYVYVSIIDGSSIFALLTQDSSNPLSLGILTIWKAPVGPVLLSLSLGRRPKLRLNGDEHLEIEFFDSKSLIVFTSCLENHINQFLFRCFRCGWRRMHASFRTYLDFRCVVQVLYIQQK